jgi:ABC-2 type transport system ATP-binding protein
VARHRTGDRRRVVEPVDGGAARATVKTRFVELAGGRKAAAGMEWLHSFTD